MLEGRKLAFFLERKNRCLFTEAMLTEKKFWTWEDIRVAKRLWQTNFFPKEFLSKISLKSIVFIGLLVRLIIAPFATSSDFEVWRGISHLVYHYGINIFKLGSHYPPLWPLTIRATYPIYLTISLFHRSIFLERLILKIPIIISDVAISVVLFRIFNKLGNKNKAKLIALLWALNPYSIWISSIWGQFDAIPTLFSILALERLSSKQIKSSALLLSISIMYKLYSIFLIPAFLIPIYRVEGKQKILEYSKIMVLTCSLLAIPWNLSFLQIKGTISTPGFEPTLSYWYVFRSIALFKSLQIYWSSVFYLLILLFLIIYFFKSNLKTLDIYELNHGILLSLLLVYLARIIFFPYYVVWSLPFLLIACLGSKKIPKRITFLYFATPILFILCWNPFVLFVDQSYVTSLWLFGGDPFRKAFAMNFSLLCILIIAYLIRKSPTNSTWSEKSKKKKFNLLNFANIIAVLCGIFLVFNHWLINYNWTSFWNSIMKYTIFYSTIIVLSVSLIIVSLNMRKREYLRLNDNSRFQKISIICLLLLWIYNAISLLANMTLSFLPTDHSQTVVQIYSEPYFSYLLILWIPLIVYFMFRAQPEALFSTICIVFLQVDLLITRHGLYYETLQNIVTQIDLLVIFCILIPLLISAAYAHPIKIQEKMNSSSS